MAFFKFRKGADDASPATVQAQSIEVMRRRARHRLIGTALLVLVGVIGFPLLFDSQPRPIAVDIPIQIPDRNKVKPLGIPAPAAAVQPLSEPVAASAASPVAAASSMAVSAASSTRPAAVPAAAASTVAVASVAAPVKAASVPAPAKPDLPAAGKATSASMDKPAVVPMEKPPTAKADDGAKAQALLEGKEPAPTAPAGEVRFIVQVGAFAEDARARDVRLKLERAGLKTYVHVAETKDGRRIRVRVGPFADKAEAQRAAEKIKTLDLPAVVLTL